MFRYIFLLFAVTFAAAIPAEAVEHTQIESDFTPRSTSSQSLDYAIWTQILNGIVVNSGPSTRHRFRKPGFAKGGDKLNVGQGHRSPYRMEGNKIAFSKITPGWKTAIQMYQSDLVKIGNEIDIPALSRNEQLAYWFNLHNVTVINALAQNYPVKHPSEFVLPGTDAVLHDAAILEIKGDVLSLRDIREKIVYPHWEDPKVIYGFFLGDIGSPTVLNTAFSGTNVDALLKHSASEYVSSLRGVHRWDEHIRASKIYWDVQQFYFPNFQEDLRAHLSALASDRVLSDLGTPEPFTIAPYPNVIADLAGGSLLKSESSIRRYTQDLTKKFKTLKRQGKIKKGTVIIEDIPTD